MHPGALHAFVGRHDIQEILAQSLHLATYLFLPEGA
jgi:hypothetical protein